MKNIANVKEISNGIRQIRIEKNLRQADVAKRAGFSRSMYARIESGLTSPIAYLDQFINVIGPEIETLFPYNINLYTNHRVLLYILCFGVDYNTVGEIMNLTSAQVKKMVTSKDKKFLLEYKDELDKLFPNMDEIDKFDEVRNVGKNSILVIKEGKPYVFLNVLERGENDVITDILY